MITTEYMTVADAAELIGSISYRQLSNYVQEGKVPSERLGHIRILKRTDVVAFQKWHAVNGGRWAK
jgi:hypothetical protein